MAKADEVGGLEPGDRFDQAARKIIAVRARELFEHSDGVLDTFVKPNIERQLAFMDAELAQRAWFSGPEFSAADVMMSFPLEVAVVRGGLDVRFTRIQEWLGRIHARAAYQRALKNGGPYSILR